MGQFWNTDVLFQENESELQVSKTKLYEDIKYFRSQHIINKYFVITEKNYNHKDTLKNCSLDYRGIFKSPSGLCNLPDFIKVTENRYL